MSKSIEELRIEEEALKVGAKKHKEWLKEKDWFIVLDADKLYDQSGKIVFRVSELKDDLEMFDELKYKGSCEFVYKTNKWKENLEELD